METARFFSCPQLSLTVPQGLSAAPRNTVTQGEVQGKLAYTEDNAKDFLVKQNMSSNEHSRVQGEDGCEGPARRSARRLCTRAEKICKGCATPLSAQETFGQLNIKTMTLV